MFELLDAVVERVRHVHVGGAIHGDGERIEELPVPVAAPAPRAQERTVAIELLNPVVLPVHRVDPAGIHGYAPHLRKLTVEPPVPAPLEQEPPAAIELLDPV